MSTKLYLLLALLLASVAAPAQQAPGWGWVNAFGQTPFSAYTDNGVAGVGRDAAGNLYMAGSYLGTPTIGSVATTNLGASGTTEVFLAKFTPAGTLLWLRTLQGTGHETAARLVVEPSGRCTVAGYFGDGTGGNLSLASFGGPPELAGPAQLGLLSTSGPTPGPYYQRIPFVAAVDAGGTLLWVNSPSPRYGFVFNDLHRDIVGNCYLSATVSQELLVSGQNYPKVGSYDAALLKLDAVGQPQWTRRVGTRSSISKMCYAYEITSDNTGALYWQIGSDGAITLDQFTLPASSPLGLVKLTGGNHVQWVKSSLFQLSGTELYANLLGTDATSGALCFELNSVAGGSITAAGLSTPVTVPAGKLSVCIARADTAGQVQWLKPVAFATYPPGGRATFLRPSSFPTATALRC